MTIGIDVSRASLSQKTGTERYSYYLIKYLALLDKKNQYLLYTNRPFIVDFYLPKNFKIKILSQIRLWSLVRLSLEMILARPDVLFIPAHILPFFYPKKTVVTIHGLEYEYFPWVYSFLQRLYLRWSTKRAINRAKKIIAISETTKKDLIKFYQASEDQIIVIPLGIEPFVLDKNKSSLILKKYLGIKNSPYLLFLGRLEERKNLTRLISAFIKIKK